MPFAIAHLEDRLVSVTNADTGRVFARATSMRRAACQIRLLLAIDLGLPAGSDLSSLAAGFTGTKYGMTARQRAMVRWLLAELAPASFHHGDCVGADCQAAVAADRLRIRCVSHPPTAGLLRAYTRFNSEQREPAPYLTRNRAIVAETAVLIGAPRGLAPVRRSGTWATVGYARKRSGALVLVGP